MPTTTPPAISIATARSCGRSVGPGVQLRRVLMGQDAAPRSCQSQRGVEVPRSRSLRPVEPEFARIQRPHPFGPMAVVVVAAVDGCAERLYLGVPSRRCSAPSPPRPSPGSFGLPYSYSPWWDRMMCWSTHLRSVGNLPPHSFSASHLTIQIVACTMCPTNCPSSVYSKAAFS